MQRSEQIGLDQGNFIQVFHMGTWVHSLGLYSIAFLNAVAGSWIEVNQPWLKLAPIWKAGEASIELNLTPQRWPQNTLLLIF